MCRILSNLKSIKTSHAQLPLFHHWNQFKVFTVDVSPNWERTDEMVSMSPQLHHVLQVVVSQDFPAARVQAAVGHFGHFLPWRCRDVMSLMNLHGFTTGSCTVSASNTGKTGNAGVISQYTSLLLFVLYLSRLLQLIWISLEISCTAFF